MTMHPRSTEFVEAECAFIGAVNEHITRLLSFPGMPCSQNLPEDESDPQVEAAAIALLGNLLALTGGDIEQVREIWPRVARGHIESFDAIRSAHLQDGLL